MGGFVVYFHHRFRSLARVPGGMASFSTGQSMIEKKTTFSRRHLSGNWHASRWLAAVIRECLLRAFKSQSKGTLNHSGPHFAVLAVALVVFQVSGRAQDVGWLLDEAPVASALLVKALEKCPSFTGKVDLDVSGKADPVPTTATGTIQSLNGNLRWNVKLADIKSAQLSSNARAVVRQVNGDQFQLLTRADLKFNYLVLPGAQAYLEQPLPAIRLVTGKPSPVAERVEGRLCTKEHMRMLRPDGSTNAVIVWKAKELKNLPVQVQFTDSGETIQVRFRDISLQPVSPDQFRLAGGLTKYSSFEDLAQSVVIDRVRRRMGL
jgi:hypothetical protein